jgi:hypothetical protein
MAVISLESLVLRGVPVVNGVVVGLNGTGSNAVHEQTSGISFPMRNPATGYPQTGAPARCMRHSIDLLDRDEAAERAGRSECRRGVVPSRSTARSVRLAILLGWPRIAGTTCLAAKRKGLATAKRKVNGQVLHGRPLALATGTVIAGDLRSPWQRPSTGLTQAALPRPAMTGGTPLASTRGKGA